MPQKGVTVETMSEIDRRAIEYYGIPQIVLMENAGRSAAEVILADLPNIRDEKIVVFCGKGNNGGDGFVVGRYLANESPKRLTIFAADQENIRPGGALKNFKIINKLGLDIRSLNELSDPERELKNCTVAVDAIFGTGFKGELPEDLASIGGYLSRLNIKLYAIDVPTGLDANQGTVSKGCFKAFKTVTFGLPKQGFYINDGPEYCGEVVVRNIGFPVELLGVFLEC